MQRRTGLLVWLVTTVVVAAAAWFGYDRLTSVPYLAGRPDPAALLTEPELLFEDPGILGSAVERRVTAAVAACMEEAGLDYRGPVAVEDLDEGYDPVVDGYGIAAALETPEIRLSGSIRGERRELYEVALYGDSLADTGGAAGCAAVGRAELAAAVAELEALPYTIEQLEQNALEHPDYLAARADWAACMAERGYPAESPEQLVADFASRLSQAQGEEARALAEEERAVAAADFACRRQTIDRALDDVAADLAPEFVEANRTQLEELVRAPEDEDSPVSLPENLGTGDVQVTLLWDTDADLDLYVTDPGGDTVFHANAEVPSGGVLDRDANRYCTPSEESVENVFWPTGAAPGGSYVAEVRLFSICQDQQAPTFQLIVQVDGRVAEQVTATLEPSGGPYRVTFEGGR
jgi:hypothetical protein